MSSIHPNQERCIPVPDLNSSYINFSATQVSIMKYAKPHLYLILSRFLQPVLNSAQYINVGNFTYTLSRMQLLPPPPQIKWGKREQEVASCLRTTLTMECNHEIHGITAEPYPVLPILRYCMYPSNASHLPSNPLPVIIITIREKETRPPSCFAAITLTTNFPCFSW